MALQTKTFSIGDRYSSALHFYKLELVLTEESVSIENNTSRINYTLTLYSGETSFIGFATGREIRLNGIQVAYAPRDAAHEVSIGRLSSYVLLSGSTDVLHNVDGTLNMSVAFSIDQAAYSYTPGPVSVTGNSMTLTPIARASTIGATDINIGSTGIISVNQKNSDYTHSIAYQFGSLSGYITADGGFSASEARFNKTNLSFTVPDSFYAQIPNSKSGVCTLTCRTYSGSTQIGSAQTCTFKVTAAQDECKPIVSGTVVDINPDTVALTGDENTLVCYYSTAFCTISAEARNGATIQKKTVNGAAVAVEDDTLSIPNVETGTFKFVAVDSRGYSLSQSEEPFTVTLPIVPYIKLTNNASGQRTDPTSGRATLNVNGKYYSGSFGAVENTLTVKYRIDGGEDILVEPEITEDGYRVETVMEGLDYQTSHTVEVEVKDKLATVVKSFPVHKGVPVFDWGESDFNSNVPMKAPRFIGSVTAPTVNDVYIRQKYIPGTKRFNIQTKFAAFDGEGNGRQTVFMFGYANNGNLVSGVLGVSDNGTVQWAGTDGVSGAAQSGGAVEMTLPAIPWDRFVFISAEFFQLI